MGEHAELSPSSANRWARCPGSVRMLKGLPHRGPSVPVRGTVMRGAGGLPQDKARKTFPFQFVGKEYAIVGLAPIVFTDEMAGHGRDMTTCGGCSMKPWCEVLSRVRTYWSHRS